MSYHITVTGSGKTYERDITTDECLGILFLLSATILLPDEPEQPKRIKKQRKPDVFDDEKPPRKTFDKEAIKRLIKDSDLSAKEIAMKMGCSYATVYTVKIAMQRNGEL